MALRNLLQGGVGDDATLLAQAKFIELLDSEKWRKAPAVGYLEAFDVAVKLGRPDLVPLLAGLIRATNNPAVSHAAYLSLDRMVINEPETMLATIAADEPGMQGRELTRADLFARLDVREESQLNLLEAYLLNPHLGAAELNQFAGVYPNANFMVSVNLLTESPVLDHVTLSQRDVAALAAVDRWLGDARFNALKPLTRSDPG